MKMDALDGWTPEQTKRSNLGTVALVLCLASYLAWLGIPEVALVFIGVVTAQFCSSFLQLSLVIIAMSAGAGFILGFPSY